MPKEINVAEEYVKIVNDNLFLKEFTFTKNELKPKEKDEIELADNIVWLDELLFLIQIKWRNPKNEKDEEAERKWFRNKVIKKAKDQIKSSIKYFEKYSNLEISNGRGFKVNLSEAPVNNAKKIIIYLPSDKLPEDERFLKFYESNDVGLINLFHFEDYKWICQYLITPCEIERYLQFREEMKKGFGNVINSIPEQLMLGKFLSGEEITTIDPKYIVYLHEFEENINEFNITPLLQGFLTKTIKQNNPTDYFFILKEIAKLSRFELKEFKTRFVLSIEKSKSKDYTIPYRIAFPRTECGFVFIPISLKDEEFRKKWTIALKNFTLAHKYDQKLKKCVGVIIFRYPESPDYIEIYWMYIESEWIKDEVMEKALKDNFPFRKVNKREIGEYKFKK